MNAIDFILGVWAGALGGLALSALMQRRARKLRKSMLNKVFDLTKDPKALRGLQHQFAFINMEIEKRIVQLEGNEKRD